MKGWNSFATEVIADFDTVFADMQRAKESSNRIFEELDNLSEGYKYDSIEWKSKLQTITEKAKQFETESQLAHKANSNVLKQVGKAMKDNAAISERLLYQGPLLSEVMGEFLTAKKTQLPEGSREIAYFEHRIRTFLEIVGDKRIAEYTEGDLTYFAGELRFLPERHTVDPRWKGKTLVAALQENRSRAPGSRARSLSFTTIKIGYVGKIKTCIRWLCANYRVQYPFDYGHTLIPKDARSSTIRFSLDSSHLNKLFAACTKDADEKRPEDVWIPLLAYFTGARLGELVGLQPQNIRQRENVDIVDLTTQIF